jgi:tetratricopeptide (TPR) repeat protein
MVAARERHCGWCLQLIPPESVAPGVALGALEREVENFRAALNWCASDEAHATVGLKLAGRLGLHWSGMGGSLADGRRWIEKFVALSPVGGVARADALVALDHNLRLLHEFAPAEQAAREALAIYHEHGDKRGIADATAHLGLVKANRGDYEFGLQLLEEALNATRANNDRQALVRRLRDIGVVCIASGDRQRARSALAESAALATNDVEVMHARVHLAVLHRLDGDLASARDMLASIPPERLAVHHGASLMLGLEQANQARAEGRFAEARNDILDTMRRFHDQSDVTFTESLALLAMCDIEAGSAAAAVSLLAVLSNVEGPLGTVHFPSVRAEVPRYLEAARAALGEDSFRIAWAAGAALTTDQVIEDVLSRHHHDVGDRSVGPAVERDAPASCHRSHSTG